MTTTLAYPAIGLSSSPISHAAPAGAVVEYGGWAKSYCGRWVSIDHLRDGTPLRAVASGGVLMHPDGESGPIGDIVSCLRCSAALAKEGW